MAISSFASALAKAALPNQRLQIVKNSSNTVSSPSFVTYTAYAGLPAAMVAPTTAVVPTNSTVGAFGQQNGGALQLRIAGYRYSNLSSQLNNQALLIDRLSHQGGLDGTVTSAQTTNLPTAALTRYTSGAGVKIGLCIYTAVGASTTTVSVSYTNSGNTPGRTSPLVVFGNTAFKEGSRIIQIPLQVGDVGVKSVESVTVTATTGTAGNFGVMLYKEIMPIIQPSMDYMTNVSPWTSLGGLCPEIFDNACLELLGFGQSTSCTALNLQLMLAEDDT